MDSITHMVTGAVIAGAVGDERAGRWGAVAGLAMGIFPDSDMVLGLFDRQSHLLLHRGLTHSLLTAPVFALFFSWVLVKASRRRELWVFYRICLLVLLSHILLDLLTSYGTMILSPLSDHRFAWDLTFLVDLVFSSIVIIPWVVSLVWKGQARRICRGSLGLLLLYILFLGVQHHRAVALAERFSQSLKERAVEVASLPQPLSPFRWANFIETEDTIYQAFVDLRGGDATDGVDGVSSTRAGSQSFLGRWVVMKHLYRSPSKIEYAAWKKHDDSPWVKRALLSKGAKSYLWFARFPIARSVDTGNGTHRVEMSDVRYFVPNTRMPFRYYMDFDDSGRIISEGSGGNLRKNNP